MAPYRTLLFTADPSPCPWPHPVQFAPNATVTVGNNGGYRVCVSQSTDSPTSTIATMAAWQGRIRKFGMGRRMDLGRTVSWARGSNAGLGGAECASSTPALQPNNAGPGPGASREHAHDEPIQPGQPALSTLRTGNPSSSGQSRAGQALAWSTCVWCPA